MFNRYNMVGNGGVPIPDQRAGIFHHKFFCRVRTADIRTINEIHKHGTPISGYAPMDDAMADEWVDRLWSIARMATHWGNGYRVRIPRYADTKLIYDNVQAHLLSWRQRVISRYNPGTCPVDDLLLLDKFANEVYDKAKYFFVSKSQDAFAEMLGRAQGFSNQDIFDIFSPEAQERAREQKNMTEQERHEARFPARQGLSELFERSFRR